MTNMAQKENNSTLLNLQLNEALIPNIFSASKFLSLLIPVIWLLLTPQLAFAQYNPSCPSVYGANCPVGNLAIHKQVKNPQTGEFVDTLDITQAAFLPGQEVDFRITVTNTGSVAVSNIQVQDKFPNFLNFLSGPGSFDQNSRTENWSIDQLQPQESQVFNVSGQLESSQSLTSLSNSCLTNFSQAQQGQQIAQSASAFCIETQVLGTTTQLPKTGPEETTPILLISTLFLITAIYMQYLNKKVKSY